ncbi:hypothetical protein M413DRAFT_28888 [Hebeloma cylindrosporum]|uniref:Protein kinase domain-containing protein n=1 Tax=Hebeloma cylindrosporum TaxID=76867 RepID=A0A0C2XRS8_HEBCY|nr:hypothetical protein M413DRAFT_28888 [Hebeloma cylindrosporum h7]
MPVLADETGFHPALEAVFDLKYPTTLVDTTSPYLPMYQPLDFYDRHLDPFVRLKYVKPLGFSLSEYLSDFCEKEIMDFVQKEKPLRSGIYFRRNPPVHKTLNTAYDVGRYYVSHISNLTTRFSTALYLHPSDEEWASMFFVVPPRDSGEGAALFRKPTALCVCTEGEMIRFRPRPNETIISDMKKLGKDFPQVATYEFYNFSAASRRLLEEMGEQEVFEWTTPGTRGYSIDRSPRELVPDVESGNWSKISSISQSTKTLRHLKGKKGRPSTTLSKNITRVNPTKVTKTRPTREKTVQPAARKGARGRPYRPAAKDFLQRAWVRAVEYDTTFIVFHCGKAERIGFRHRETQTLYLSELIDPSVEKYGKIQIGLHLAIVKDVLEREASLSSPKKRPAEPTASGQPSKRQKSHDQAEDIDTNPSSCDSLNSRDLALVSLDRGLFRSPVPSSFFRVEVTWDPVSQVQVEKEPRRKARYPPSEYFSVSLGNEIGSGAVGIIHRASARFRSGSTTYEHPRLAVKLAFLEAQQASLRHEYAIYKLLVRRGVTQNILPVYGMFQDVETGLLVLVMEHGGDSIASRQPAEDDKISFTKQERTTITNAFRNLHGAGILHGDIRRNNLLLDSSGAFYIIDFDQAVVEAEEEAFRKEMEELFDVLGVHDESDGDEAAGSLEN